MDEPRYCPIHSAMEAAFDAADHEDLSGDDLENIEKYDCPACDGVHRYINGRFTLAPTTIQCAASGCDEPAVPEYTRGLRGFCSREHRVLSRRRAEAFMRGDDPAEVTVGDLSRSDRWDPAMMQERIDEFRRYDG